MRRFQAILFSVALALTLTAAGALANAQSTEPPSTGPGTTPPTGINPGAQQQIKQQFQQLKQKVQADRSKLQSDIQQYGKNSPQVKADRRQISQDHRAVQRFKQHFQSRGQGAKSGQPAPNRSGFGQARAARAHRG